MKRGPHRAAAEAIVRGPGTPRITEQIIADVERGLEAAHRAGELAAGPAARERSLREALAIARGIETEARGRRIAIEQQLAEMAGYESIAAWRAARGM